MKNSIFLIIFLVHLRNTKCKACEIKAKSPCILPFIFKNETYNSCTKEGSNSDEFWCATYVNDTSHFQDDHNWARCKDFCASENIDNEIKTCVPVDETSCKFPFIFGNKTYNSCTEADWDEFWCSTFINSTNHYQEGHWGYCDESCLPGDIAWYNNWYIIVLGTLASFTLVILLILYCLGKLRSPCYGNFFFTFRNCCLKKSFNYDQEKPDETLEMKILSPTFGCSLALNSQIAEKNGNLINFVLRNVTF